MSRSRQPGIPSDATMRPRNPNLSHQRIRRDIARRTIATLGRLLAVGLILMLILAALYSRPFEVQDISITGLASIPRERVEAVARGLIGQNLFRAGTRAVRRALLAMPEVKDVRIHRTLRRTIALSVIERQPFAALPDLSLDREEARSSDPSGKGTSPGNAGSSRRIAPLVIEPVAPAAPALQNPEGYTIIDAAGMGFKQVTEVPEGLVVFRDSKTGGLPFGKRLSPRLLERLQRCLNDCQAARLPRPRAVQHDSAGGMTVVFADGLIVRLGPDLWREKLKSARTTLVYVKSQGKVAASIDLRSLEAPVWRPKEGSNNESSAGAHPSAGGAHTTSHRTAAAQRKPG